MTVWWVAVAQKGIIVEVQLYTNEDFADTAFDMLCSKYNNEETDDVQMGAQEVPVWQKKGGS
jgi:hypothetical protein